MTREVFKMKEIIHTLGFIDDNDDIVMMGIIHDGNGCERIIRFTFGEEITAQVLESRTEFSPEFISGIIKGENS